MTNRMIDRVISKVYTSLSSSNFFFSSSVKNLFSDTGFFSGVERDPEGLVSPSLLSYLKGSLRDFQYVYREIRKQDSK